MGKEDEDEPAAAGKHQAWATGATPVGPVIAPSPADAEMNTATCGVFGAALNGLRAADVPAGVRLSRFFQLIDDGLGWGHETARR